MDGPAIARKVWRGYGIAGKKTGFPHDFYRPASCDADPIVPDNKFLTQPVSFYMEEGFLQPQKYGINVWRIFLDGTLVQVGDYLVDQDGGGTYFLISLQPDLPIQVTECNCRVSIYRSACAGTVGATGYQATTAATQSLIVNNFPASQLKEAKGSYHSPLLPNDVQEATFTFFLPILPGGEYIFARDVLVNDHGERFAVSSNELTALGWRLGVTRQLI